VFKIGEFSHIARVTTKLLRFYDRLGLLTPAHVDPDTGYRYYLADQLPRLNRILALKDLGLSLADIRDLVEAEVPAAQLKALLAAKRAELNRRVEADLLRLRLIESRIDGIDGTRAPEVFDLRTKTLEPIPWISHRFACTEPAHAFHIVSEIIEVAQRCTELAAPPHRLAVGHGDFHDTEVDLEAGVIVRHLPATADLVLPAGTRLTAATLPPVDALTGIRIGLPELSSEFYAALGHWLTANDAEICGPVRELFIQVPDAANGIEPIVEVQFPIRGRAANHAIPTNTQEVPETSPARSSYPETDHKIISESGLDTESARWIKAKFRHGECPSHRSAARSQQP
jgi:DNA-binding transcriptional MerR regulator